jgi:hypothetical protein
MANNPSLLSNKNIHTIKFHIQTECKLDTTDISHTAIKQFLIFYKWLQALWDLL